MRGNEDVVEIKELLEIQETENIDPDRTSDIIEKLKREGELFEPQKGYIQQI